MTKTLTVRPARRTDEPDIARLIFAVLDEYGLPRQPDTVDADLTATEAEYQARGGRFDVLIDDAGALVGTVALYPLDERRVELRKMYFHPDIRGRGFGKAVLSYSLDQARELGFEVVELETATVLTEAIGLYLSYGFERIAATGGTGRCDCRYRLELTGYRIPAPHAGLLEIGQ